MTDAEVTERQISTLVRAFYERARADDQLAPLFDAAIQDWDEHLRIVADFWSHVLLGTGRYRGSPFVPHTRLPIELGHFSRWLDLFSQTAVEVLPEPAATKAIAKARHMTESFKAGLFPWKTTDGTPSRHKP